MSSFPKADLRLDWCSYEAAKYAVEHWHYLRTMPAGRNVYVGAWEAGRFIGSVMFGMGSGSSTNGTAYGLDRTHEVAELVRVALDRHSASVTKIVSIAIAMLRKQSPNLRLIISMADPVAGHVGAIYQGGNWIYTGLTKPDVQYFSRGVWVHHRTATSRGSARGLPSKPLPGKFRYLMPLDAAMRARIAPLAKPYPKRVRSAENGTEVPTSGGGVIPTRTHQAEAVAHG